MTINLNSKKIQEVYAEYSNEDSEGVPKFYKIHKIVELSKLGDELYVSRSQAQRNVLGLEVLTMSI